jgi:hypothetical protein
MNALNRLLGLLTLAAVAGFLYVWLFSPAKKQALEDWWYGATIDCVGMQGDIASHRRCELSPDCQLSGRETRKARDLESRYARYCSRD